MAAPRAASRRRHAPAIDAGASSVACASRRRGSGRAVASPPRRRGARSTPCRRRAMARARGAQPPLLRRRAPRGRPHGAEGSESGARASPRTRSRSRRRASPPRALTTAAPPSAGLASVGGAARGEPNRRDEMRAVRETSTPRRRKEMTRRTGLFVSGVLFFAANIGEDRGHAAVARAPRAPDSARLASTRRGRPPLQRVRATCAADAAAKAPAPPIELAGSPVSAGSAKRLRQARANTKSRDEGEPSGPPR